MASDKRKIDADGNQCIDPDHHKRMFCCGAPTPICTDCIIVGTKTINLTFGTVRWRPEGSPNGPSVQRDPVSRTALGPPPQPVSGAHAAAPFEQTLGTVSVDITNGEGDSITAPIGAPVTEQSQFAYIWWDKPLIWVYPDTKLEGGARVNRFRTWSYWVPAITFSCECIANNRVRFDVRTQWLQNARSFRDGNTHAHSVWIGIWDPINRWYNWTWYYTGIQNPDPPAFDDPGWEIATPPIPTWRWSFSSTDASLAHTLFTDCGIYTLPYPWSLGWEIGSWYDEWLGALTVNLNP